MVKPTPQSLPQTSSLTSTCITISFQHSLLQIISKNLQKSPFLAPAPAFATENPSGSSKIDGLSPFQVHRIHLETVLQYFPSPRVPAPGSYLYRSRNSAPEGQFS